VSRGGTPENRTAGESPRPLRARELLATLRRHNVDFVVIGGFALAPHGYVRATKGVDIVPDPEPGNIDRLARALREMDARPDLGEVGAKELGIPLDEAGLSLGRNRVLSTRFGRLDVMQDVPGLRSYDHLRAGAVRVHDVLYAGYDELISMKAASGGDEDLRDIGALEAARREA
jgi:hypothetical protein